MDATSTFAELFAPPWMSDIRVKCKGLTKFFYPNQPSSEVATAKAVCNGLDGNPPCYWRGVCLRYAIDSHESYGVWGGTSERDRRKIQRARNKYKNPNIYSLEDVKYHGVVIVQRRVTVTKVSVQRAS
jgi:hypothetical protein